MNSNDKTHKKFQNIVSVDNKLYHVVTNNQTHILKECENIIDVARKEPTGLSTVHSYQPSVTQFMLTHTL